MSDHIPFGKLARIEEMALLAETAAARRAARDAIDASDPGDMRTFLLECAADAAARGLNPPTPAERRLREIAALRILARGNVTERNLAKYYAIALRETKVG